MLLVASQPAIEYQQNYSNISSQSKNVFRLPHFRNSFLPDEYFLVMSESGNIAATLLLNSSLNAIFNLFLAISMVILHSALRIEF